MKKEQKTKKTILGHVILFVLFIILMLKGVTCGVDWNHVDEAERYLDNYYGASCIIKNIENPKKEG